MFIPIWFLWASMSTVVIVSYLLGSFVSNSRNTCICMDCMNKRKGDLGHENI